MGGEQRVADAVFADCLTHVIIHLQHIARVQIGFGIEQRERAFFFRKIHRREVRRTGNQFHPGFGLSGSFIRTIALAQHQQRVRQTSYAKTNPAFGLGFLTLRFQRKARHVNHIVHHANCSAHQFVQCLRVQFSVFLKRVGDQTCQVDRAQQAGAIRRQRLFATRLVAAICSQ